MIDYVVTDGCGNTTTGGYQLEVIDNFAPVAICDEFTVASIGSPTPGVTGDGTVTIPAATFDDGSYDNCGQVWFKVRRMTIGGCNGLNGDDAPTPPYFQYFGFQEWFDDSASFCCDDETVMVIFRVYDVDPGPGPVEDLSLIHISEPTRPY